MNKQVEKIINQVFESVFKKVYNQNKKSLLKGSKKEIINSLLRLEESKKFKTFASKVSKELAKKALSSQNSLWKKYFKIAKKRKYIVLPDTYKEFQLAVYKKAVQHNFKMIKTIPQQVLKVYEYQYIDTLIKQVAEGNLPRGSFEKQLKNDGHKNAKVIARTETAKLQTTITENRSLELGSKAYFWIASNDARTRESHKNMNNVVVFWRPDNEKPKLDNMQGNAGEFPNCRCDASPILDERDLIRNNYSVYDYRTHKIITMNKSKLIECLKKGQL